MSSATPMESRVARLENSLTRSRRLNGLLIAGTSVLLCAAFLSPRSTREEFTELTVERLNVVEPDGQLVVAIANRDRLPEPLIEGKTVETGRKGPGMIFFDGKGWEVGGLLFGTEADENGYQSSGHLSLDQYHNDQVVYLNHFDNGESKMAGLHVVDRDRELTIDKMLALRDGGGEFDAEELRALKGRAANAMAKRIFLGSEDETAVLRMQDRDGRPRILLSVDSEGGARLTFLDEYGDVVLQLPD